MKNVIALSIMLTLGLAASTAFANDPAHNRNGKLPVHHNTTPPPHGNNAPHQKWDDDKSHLPDNQHKNGVGKPHAGKNSDRNEKGPGKQPPRDTDREHGGLKPHPHNISHE